MRPERKQSNDYLPKIKLSTTTILFVLGSAYVCGADAAASGDVLPLAAVEFDPAFVSGRGIDVSLYATGNPLVPGMYSADIYVNGQMFKRGEFRVTTRGGMPTIELSEALLLQIGVKKHLLAAARVAHAAAPDSTDDKASSQSAPVFLAVRDISADVSALYNSSDLRLDLSFPQVTLNSTPRGYVDPSMWQEGDTALMTNYSLNTYRGRFDGRNNYSNFGSANVGLNVGPWQFRGALTATSGTGRPSPSFRTNQAYVQRSIVGLQSRFVAGDTYTGGQFFNATPMRGVTLTSDERMLPDPLRGYVPVIRGMAETNAKVAIRQNGQLLYEISVAPGNFEINDVPATAYGGTLDVIVTEADGRVKAFEVPFASVPQLLRPGTSRYSTSVGQIRNANVSDQPVFGEATYQRGLTNNVTAYGGVQLAPFYASVLGGLALNTPMGAFGFDTMGSKASLNTNSSTGFSSRLSYSNYLQETGTNFSLAAYRYSSSDFLNLQDAAYLRSVEKNNAVAPPPDVSQPITFSTINQRNALQLNINQSIGKSTSLFVTGAVADYWKGGGRMATYQAGFSQTVRKVSYNVSLARTRDALTNRNTTAAMFTATIPLGSAGNSPTLTSSLNRGSDGSSAVRASVSGNYLEDRSLAYSVYANHSSGSTTDNSGGVSVSKQTSLGTITGSASQGGNYTQGSLGMMGSVMVHSSGVTFGPYAGDTVALVEAEGAAGAALTNQQGVKLNSRGQAIVPFLMPFRDNEIGLDPTGTSFDVELKETSQRIAPIAGSMVKVKFATERGIPSLLSLRLGDEGVPMGATATDESGRVLGMIGAGGQLFARNLPQSGLINVSYGADLRCAASYILPTAAKPGTQGVKSETTLYAGEIACIPQN